MEIPAFIGMCQKAYEKGLTMTKEEQFKFAEAEATNINLLLKAYLKENRNVPGSPEDVMMQILGANVLSWGNEALFKAIFEGIDTSNLTLKAPNMNPLVTNGVQTGGTKGGILLLVIFLSVLASHLLDYVGEGKPVAPTPAANFGTAARSATSGAITAVLPRELQLVGLPAGVKEWWETYVPTATTYPEGLTQAKTYTPSAAIKADYEKQRKDARDAANEAASELQQVQLTFTTKAAPIMTCLNPGMRCGPDDMQRAQILQFLTNPTTQLTALQYMIDTRTDMLTARAETVAQTAKVTAARALIGDEVAGALPTATRALIGDEVASELPPPPAPTAVATNEGKGSWRRLFGNLAEALPEGVSSAVASGVQAVKVAGKAAANTVAEARTAIVSSTKEAARQTLANAAARQAERNVLTAELANIRPYAEFIGGFSADGVIRSPLQFYEWFINGITGLPPVITRNLQPVRNSIDLVQQFLAEYNAVVPVTNVGNGTAVVARPLMDNATFVDMLVRIDEAYAVSQQRSAVALAYETHAVALRIQTFEQHKAYFLEQLGRRLGGNKDRIKILTNTATAIDLLGRAPAPDQADEIITSVLSSYATGEGMLTAAELYDRSTAYNQPQNIQLVRAFQRTIFLTLVMVGGLKGVEFLVFGMIGGILSLILRVGTGVVAGGEIVARGTARAVGPPVMALSRLLTLLFQIPEQRLRARFMPQRPALANAAAAEGREGQGGGRRKTRRRRGKAKKDKHRKSRRYRR